MKKKPSLFTLVLTIAYCWLCFFCLGLGIDVVVMLINMKGFDFSITGFIYLAKMSGVAGLAAGLGSWIFAKIDEYNARKKSPTDPNE
ncbi:hypothetical protein [Rahnella bonaserana]|jgi:hypothetical protein